MSPIVTGHEFNLFQGSDCRATSSLLAAGLTNSNFRMGLQQMQTSGDDDQVRQAERLEDEHEYPYYNALDDDDLHIPFATIGLFGDLGDIMRLQDDGDADYDHDAQVAAEILSTCLWFSLGEYVDDDDNFLTDGLELSHDNVWMTVLGEDEDEKEGAPPEHRL